MATAGGFYQHGFYFEFSGTWNRGYTDPNRINPPEARGWEDLELDHFECEELDEAIKFLAQEHDCFTESEVERLIDRAMGMPGADQAALGIVLAALYQELESPTVDSLDAYNRIND